MIRSLLFLAAFVLASTQARCTGQITKLDLVTALSSDVMSIQSNFTGTEIVIFGQAQQYRAPAQRSERL